MYVTRLSSAAVRGLAMLDRTGNHPKVVSAFSSSFGFTLEVDKLEHITCAVHVWHTSLYIRVPPSYCY